ncbi:MAG: hypothetical protein ACREN7_00105 [Candidatus Dormibacteria bacterium]
MTTTPAAPPPIPTRPLYRRVCFYSPGGAETIAILNGLGLTTKGDWSAAEHEAIQAMANQALLLGGSPTGNPVPVSAFFSPADGRLCVVLPTVPQVIMVETGPVVQRPSPIMGPGGTAIPSPSQAN